MKEYGIIGKSLSHSFSPKYFNNKFGVLGLEAHFEIFEIPHIESFKQIIAQHRALAGLCVTIPYKELIMPYLDEIDPVAADIGAVNCIQFKQGKLKGYNTDISGFVNSLVPILPAVPVKALVLGTGGASKAVLKGLESLGIPYTLVSRMVSASAITYADVDATLLSAHKLIINTTPLGTFPEVHTFPDLPYAVLSDQHILYDLVYNPAETAFLQKGKAAGAVLKNGLEMLELQAEANWRIWNE
ncbi:shikimate dehydrogenase [Taibaiella sp. KBW10]|uniref:shikimate dehydrogenase family protein n=1 Tax=Taibaiella sp. KBW10 TaxID=2153357 RepID=UPI000F5B50C8|nr:shikimate dehydrogenase [Taibaiella sp. KBW10]RQO30328.1 shikimate dehydrogenase [Taibaiella sp. KBW10]